MFEVLRLRNFNCTIQELKLARSGEFGLRESHFNCTIQELKRELNISARAARCIFQLHHTGIKTARDRESAAF